jgi:hypothetical protein
MVSRSVGLADDIRVVVSDAHFFSCAYQGGTLYVIDGVKGIAKVNETGLESIDGGGTVALSCAVALWAGTVACGAVIRRGENI